MYCKAPPLADRSPGLCRSAAGGAAPTPPGPCAAWEGRPDQARRLTAGPARRDLMLTWSRAVALSNRGAGRPAALLRTGSVLAGRVAGCHTARPPSARYAPSRAKPARVRHYAIPRPGTQPHPAKRPDWLSAPPAWGFRAFHWPE